MAKGIFGRKIGMTEIFESDGTRVPVTVIKAGPCVVVRKKSTAGKDGYASLVIGFEDVRSATVDGEVKFKTNRPTLGLYKKVGIAVPKRVLKEIRLPAEECDKYEVGSELTATLFRKSELVDVIGTSKGRGFTGVMRRHNFAGSLSMSHGTHEYDRHGGAVATNTTPGRILKGKRMAGHHGNTRTTIQNLRVAEIDEANGLILIRGGVPGPNGGLVFVRDAVKHRRLAKYL